MALSEKVAGAARRVNPWVLRMSSRVPPWVTVHHVGRETGKPHQTPVVAFAARAPIDPTATAAPGMPVEIQTVRDILVVVPLPWGPTTDWFQDVQRAGTFTLTRAGVDYAVERLRVVGAEEASRLGAKAWVAAHAGVDEFLVGTLRRRPLPAI